MTELAPLALSFGSVTSLTQVELMPAGLVDFTDTFTTTGSFTKYTEGTAGTFSVTSNVGTLTHTSTENDIVTETSSSFAAPQVWVQVDVPAIPTPCGTGYDNAGVGIVKDANNFLFASIDRLAGQGRLQIKIGGTNTFLVSVSATWTAPFSIALSLVGNSACLWKYSGGSWSSVTGVDVTSEYDFRTTGNLSGWRAGFTLANGGASSVWNFANLKSGRFGRVGMRDMTVVTNQDGSTYISGSKVYFTATCADPMGFIAGGGSYCGVFSLDLSTNTIAQTGTLMISRGGKIYNDQNAHIIVYPNGDRRLTIATWGNFFGGTLQILHGLIVNGAMPDLLTSQSVVSSMSALSLPLSSSGVGCYDAMLAYDTATSLWLIGYIITNNTSFTGNPFYAALASSPDLVTWTLIGADTGNTGWEGAKLVFANNLYWLLAGGPAGSGNSSRIYNSSMSYVGALPGAVFSGGTVTQPHPMVFENPDGIHQTLLTFNATKYGSNDFTWGQPTLQSSQRYIPTNSNFFFGAD